MTDTIEVVAGGQDKEQQRRMAQELVDKARREGVDLVGPDGLLAGLTKQVLETALEEGLTDHLSYQKHDPGGCDGGNSRNGYRSKTVLIEIGPVQIDVPRDGEGPFEPQIVKHIEHTQRQGE